MELKNSVVVDLDKYNELRDFKRELKNKKVSVVYRDRVYSNVDNYDFISVDDAVIMLSNINKKNEVIYLDRIDGLEKNISDIYNFNFLQLIKWYFKK